MLGLAPAAAVATVPVHCLAAPAPVLRELVVVSRLARLAALGLGPVECSRQQDHLPSHWLPAGLQLGWGLADWPANLQRSYSGRACQPAGHRHNWHRRVHHQMKGVCCKLRHEQSISRKFNLW